MLQGLNGDGQVGSGTTSTPLLPVLISSSMDWAALALGTASSCATKSNGTLYCWGSNAFGLFGDNSTISRTIPTAATPGLTWTTVAVGAQAVCGVPGTPVAPPLPALPPAPPLFELPDCWGTNGAGQFGNGSTAGRRLLPANTSTAVWQQISLSDTTACGIQRLLLKLYCWGTDRERFGSLGDGLATSQYVPQEVFGGGQWQSVFAASGWGCGIRADGGLYCWGNNRWGSLGDGTFVGRATPAPVAGFAAWANLPPRDHGGHFICAIRPNSYLLCWVSPSILIYAQLSQAY